MNKKQATKALEQAFINLRKNGYIALHKYWCCQSCGFAALEGRINRRMEGGDFIKGAMFYHQQDHERAVSEGYLMISYDGHMESQVATGKALVAALEKEGLQVEWDGSPGTRVKVILWTNKDVDRIKSRAVMVNGIPLNVIEALADVRDWGRYNMFAREDVIRSTGMYDANAQAWLTANKDRYMDALNEMGAQVAR